jgi:transcriptional regulator with XRE-family HTH domain
MPDIYSYIGQKIRELRSTFQGTGMSQEKLATEMNTTANTISRWETATYKPSIQDLERLARIFSVPIGAFFLDPQPAAQINALLSATGDLDEDDLEEVTRYAQFRKARAQLKKSKRKG